MAMGLMHPQLDFLRHSRPGCSSLCSCPPHLAFRSTAGPRLKPAEAQGYSPGSSGQPETAKERQRRIGDAARRALARATAAVKRYGWMAFWIQLTLSVISSIILLFSVAFTSQSGPRSALYLTLLGIIAGFMSCFWNFVYTRTGLKMQQFLNGNGGSKIKKQTVLDMVSRGVIINVVGISSTLLGIQALVGLLVAKTLSTASSNPLASSSYNPVLALDVFLVQAATNTLLGHFLSLICSLWLLNVLGEGQSVLSMKQPSKP